MTTRFVALTVVLEKETRDDDAQAVIDAIKMVRGVAEVVPVIDDPVKLFMYGKVKREIVTKLLEVLEDA